MNNTRAEEARTHAVSPVSNGSPLSLTAAPSGSEITTGRRRRGSCLGHRRPLVTRGLVGRCFGCVSERFPDRKSPSTTCQRPISGEYGSRVGDDAWFRLLVLVALGGGLIRSAWIRNRRGPGEQHRVLVAGSDAAERPVYRRHNNSVWKAAIAFPLLLIPLGAVAGLTPFDLVVLAGLSGAMGAAGWRMGDTGVYPRPEGLRVVNFFRTRTFGWDEVDHVEVEDFPSGSTLVTRDGERIRMTALQKSNPLLTGDDTKVDELVAELNALVRRHQGADNFGG